MLRSVTRALLSFAVVLATLPVVPTLAQGPAAPAAPDALKAADAATLLGDWTVAAEGMQGPTTFDMSFKADGDVVVGAINAASMSAEPIPITDIRKSGDDVVLWYSFYYDANTLVETAVTLTRSGETFKAMFDFANGSYYMPGTLTRKPK
jgi:hypothetical protein